MGMKSSTLEGLWWSLDEKTSGKVMLSNTTADEVSAQLNLEWRSMIVPTPPIWLPAHETVVLEIDKLLKDNGIDGRGIERGGLSITHSGPPGALVAHGLIQDEARRFMSSLNFIDPAAQPTSALDGTGLMLGRPPRDSVFPEGSLFTPRLALRNASGSPQTATVTVRYTTGGRLQASTLPVVNLQPHEVRMVDFSRLVAGLSSSPVSEAGLKIESSGELGSLVASLSSIDEAHSLVVDVPLESKRDNSAKGGNHPFRLDDNYRSVAYLTNITARPTKVAAIIFYEAGIFTPELISVAAGETVAVDLQQLRDAQTKDLQGRTLPRDLHKGQFFWHPHGGEALAGRVITLNKAAGIVSNFSCPNCCQLEPNRLEFIPAPVAGLVGGSQQLTVNEWDSYCGQFSVGPNNYTNSVAYSCDNTSVATVSAGGLVTCVSVGTATITASLDYFHSDLIGVETCGLVPATLAGSCPVTVPPSVAISGRNAVPLGTDVNTIQLTATGTPAGGTYLWSTTSSLVTLTNTSSATVTVRSVSQSSSRNDVVINLAYTVNVQTAHTLTTLTVQKPTSLGRTGTDSTTNFGSCATNQCGVTRTFDYQVNDQLGAPIQVAGMQFWDSIVNTSTNSCNLASYTTTCSPQNTGPCGKSTLANGTFHETLFICTPACHSTSGFCFDFGCTTIANQTWTVNGITLTGDVKQISYKCQQILVNGQ